MTSSKRNYLPWDQEGAAQTRVGGHGRPHSGERSTLSVAGQGGTPRHTGWEQCFWQAQVYSLERVRAFGKPYVIQCDRNTVDHLERQDTEKSAVRGQPNQEAQWVPQPRTPCCSVCHSEKEDRLVASHPSLVQMKVLSPRGSGP